MRQKILGSTFRPVLAHFLRRARAIIATSPGYIESSPVLRRFRERCRVIPLGIETEKFERVDVEAVRRIREQYGARIVLGVGRLIYYKGFEHLVRAMRDVEGQLLIIGEGPLRGDLERQRDALNLRERVHFLGEVADAVPYFQAADVFALSSIARSEAFGIVQLEALACGLPVVNTRLASGVPFVSPDGVSGITIPPADSRALAAALNKLLADPSLRARYGEAGRRRVRAEFTAEVMAARTLALYREIVDSHASLNPAV
ncbi:MAG: glycosyltransferase [Acidobacteria bacterium]|nr:glycosyltransferase [Acidobacteriota bacterium]